MSMSSSGVILDPYIFFTGNCRQAMEFYKKVFGGELTIQTLKDVGMGDEATGNNVMHALLSGGDIKLMASDGDRREPYPVCQITLSLGGDDEAHLTKLFEQLAEGGKVTSALKKESWGDVFGTLTDQFGIDWMVNINAPKA